MAKNKLEEYGEDENREDEYNKIINQVEKIEFKQKEFKETKPKENILKQMWNKTIFPDKIKNYRANKKMHRDIQIEAGIEAMKDVKPLLIKKYKEMELKKMTEEKKKKNWGQKLAAGFSTGGSGMSEEKMRRLLGTKSDSGKTAGGFGGMGGLGGLNPDKKIDMMLGNKKPIEKKGKKKKSTKKKNHEQDEPQEKERTAEDKIREMLR